MITRNDVLAHLEKNMRLGFLMGSKDYQPLRSAFVRETTSDGAFETYADLGAAPWPRQNGGQAGAQGTDGRIASAQQTGGVHEGGQIQVVGGNEISQIVFNSDWDVTIGVWHNAINDDRVGGLENWALNAGTRFQQHMDWLCFDALNTGAANTHGLAYDGQVFFYASHVDPSGEYQTAQSNVNTSTLSLDNFETIYVAATEYKDDRGQPAGYSPNLLIYPPAYARTAAQIIQNIEDYGTANRAINPYAGKIQGLEAPGGYIDSTSWFLAVGNLPQKPINLQIREAPTLISWDDHTQGNGIRYFKWVSRYEVFYGNWRLCTQGNT